MDDTSKLSGEACAAAAGSSAAKSVSGELVHAIGAAIETLESAGIRLALLMDNEYAGQCRSAWLALSSASDRADLSADEPADVLRAPHSSADDVLVGLGQHIYDKAIQARREEADLRSDGLYDKAKTKRTEIAVLVELSNELDRRRIEARQPLKNAKLSDCD